MEFLVILSTFFSKVNIRFVKLFMNFWERSLMKKIHFIYFEY